MSEHPADCEEVLASVYAFHDHELSEAEADRIREHLMACEPCLDRFDVEEAMRLLVKRCCSQERAPEELRIRIRSQLFISWRTTAE